MKRTTNQLRARTLDTTALEKANGGRGTCCGASIHCDACGHMSTTADWASCSNMCPFCDCPKAMSASSWNTNGRYR